MRELSVRFHTAERSFAAVDGISFDLQRGESLALIGESGSGKTTAALSLIRLLPAGARVTGRVELSGTDLLKLPPRRLPRVRGRQIAMIFHDPLAALNPVLRIATQIGECIDAADARGETQRLLRAVGLGPEAADAYPHQLSGGMRQRALIAMAIACGPAVLIADEPTSALDPVNQAAIADLLRDLCRQRGLSLLLATHDLGLAARLCGTVAVLHGGRIVERAPAAELLRRPLHPYTAGLLRSLPPPLDAPDRTRLEPIPGVAPPPWDLPEGCGFRGRCSRAQPDCARETPPLRSARPAHEVACFHPVEAA